MGRQIKILFVEDSEADTGLMLNVLAESFDVESERVFTEQDIRKSLSQNKWDIVISDYVMPSISAMDVLNIVEECKQEIPVIVVSGMLVDEIAPELIKAGAVDFVNKDNLTRLVAAVEREAKHKPEQADKAAFKADYELMLNNPAKKPMTIKSKILVGFICTGFSILMLGLIISFKSIGDIEKFSRDKAELLGDSIVAGIRNSSAPNESNQVYKWIDKYTNDRALPAGYKIAMTDAQKGIVAGNIDIIIPLNTGALPGASAGGQAPLNAYFFKEKTSKVFTYLMFIPVELAGQLNWLVIDYTKANAVFMSYGKNHILILFSIVLLCIFVIFLTGNFATKAVIVPLAKIKRITERIYEDDYETSAKVKRMDEIGEIIFALEKMRIHLKDTIDKLKNEIGDRQLAEKSLHSVHLKLTQWVSELDRRTHEITLLNQMGKMLQACKTIDEFYVVTLRFTEQLFPEELGAVYISNDAGNFVEAVVTWGKSPLEHSFAPDDCWAMRSGHHYSANGALNQDLLCRHIKSRGTDKAVVSTICIPMMAQGEIIGIFHLRNLSSDTKEQSVIAERRNYARQQLAGAVAEHITLALSNLKLQDSLRQQSIHDPLTGLFNRRYMKDALERELYRAKRHNLPFGIIMFDIDHFKKFNDDFGHDVGDMILERMGKMVQILIRPEDIPCRYGGEEFLIILPGAGKEGAKICAERMLGETKNIRIKNRGALMGGITISLGIAIYPDNGVTSDEIVKAADKAMLSAKQAGRNCVIESGNQNVGDNQTIQ